MIQFTNNAAIVEGQSVGGISLDTPPVWIKDWFLSPSNFAEQGQIKAEHNFNLVLPIQAHAIEIEIDFFAQAIRSLKARPGYQGKWRTVFQPAHFSLIDLLRFDWTFEHMSRGLIVSEHYPGIGFVVPEYFEDEVHFLERVSSTYEMAKTRNFLIEEILVFPQLFSISLSARCNNNGLAMNYTNFHKLRHKLRLCSLRERSS